jgi:maltose alpha-D-glucosyltransferase/alpha-amylase
LSDDHSRTDKHGRHRLIVEGYGYRWYRVGGLDYLLRRSEVDNISRPPAGGAKSKRERRLS